MLTDDGKSHLIKALLDNNISAANLSLLRDAINEADLAMIIRRIYDLNEEHIKRIAALAPVMAKVDAIKNSRRNKVFYAKVKGNFRNVAGNKVIVAEGDSWFNYPILLSDVIDWLGMNKNLAVYSLASGGDWLLNMLSARKYVEFLSTINPDVFIISGGGNDLVGRNRLAAMVVPSGDANELANNEWAAELIRIAKQRLADAGRNDDFDTIRFENGLRYISKDFFALLMFFHLQYHFIFNGILDGGSDVKVKSKFPNLKIITQGYDYAIPSADKGFGKNLLKWFKPFARMFLGHGSWLKVPLELRGIADEQTQRDIVYSMIFLFNEMMIDTGNHFNQKCGSVRIFHIDSRGSVGENGWTDELHPLPRHFRNTGLTFIDCINEQNLKSNIFTVKILNP